MIENLIGGQRVASNSGRTQPVYNPATGASIDELGLSSADEVNQAVAAAKAAFPQWSNTPPLKRAAIMFKFNELLEKHSGDIAREISREHGKTHDDARLWVCVLALRRLIFRAWCLCGCIPWRSLVVTRLF